MFHNKDAPGCELGALNRNEASETQVNKNLRINIKRVEADIVPKGDMKIKRIRLNLFFFIWPDISIIVAGFNLIITDWTNDQYN